MFSLTEKILLTLAGVGDLLNQIPTKGDWYRLKYSFEERPAKKSYVQALSRLLETGRLEKKIEKGEAVFRMTPRGWSSLQKTYSLDRLRRGKWDGVWRQVVFDVEEKFRSDRDFIRNKLKELGFGMLQESVWISPFPLEGELEEFFSQYKIRGEVLILVSSIYSGDGKELAKRAFGLAELNGRYEELVEGWLKIEATEKKPVREHKVTRWEAAYFDLLATDPFLPRELLPAPWFGFEAREIYLQKVKKPFWKRLLGPGSRRAA